MKSKLGTIQGRAAKCNPLLSYYILVIILGRIPVSLINAKKHLFKHKTEKQKKTPAVSPFAFLFYVM